MTSSVQCISDYADTVRLSINCKTHEKKSDLEQYFSSASIATLMSSMMSYKPQEIDILDPGAGIGSLFVACVDDIVRQTAKPRRVTVTAYEIDPCLFPYLKDALRQCKASCKRKRIAFEGRLIKKDFVADAVRCLRDGDGKRFSHVITNPPYKKISSLSETYRILKSDNLLSPNMYSAFVTLSRMMLREGGEMAFISPRSFCNGPYFEAFRKSFLKYMSLRKVHTFKSRSLLFNDDDVLQENVIVHAVKSKISPRNVRISSNSEPEDLDMTVREVRKETVVYPDDPQRFIHIVPDRRGARISAKMRKMKSTLGDLGICVSTGRVVDFRIQEALRRRQGTNTAPLIHPFNLVDGRVSFPAAARKENHMKVTERSKRLLVENGNYVLVKRFSSKEERKRVTASLWQASDHDSPLVGFENKINYFHHDRKGLDLDVAKGLLGFLNSSLVDLYFRQFNGHTQVNATDLRYIRYPSLDQLKALGRGDLKSLRNRLKIQS